MHPHSPPYRADGLASHWCLRTTVGRRCRSASDATATAAAAAGKDENWKMFDVRLPLGGQLEKLDSSPLHAIDSHCTITQPA